jgi:hypothetical protein
MRDTRNAASSLPPSRKGLSRRALLAAAASTALMPSVVFAQGLATEVAAESLSGLIGGKIANAALSQATSFAFGQVLSVFGLGGDQTAEIISKLDEINSQLTDVLQRLHVLRTAVETLQNSVDVAAAQTKYASAVAAVVPLISQNDSLRDKYQLLLSATQVARAGAMADIVRVMEQADFVNGLQDWNNALCGTGGDNPGLIAGWNDVVFHRSRLFGAKAAQDLQAHWDYYDAQQAMFMLYWTEHLNKTGQRTSVPGNLRLWQSYRRTQLAKLRGLARATDVMRTIGDSRAARFEETFINVLPEGVVVDTKTDIMWYLQIFPEVSEGVANVGGWSGPPYEGALRHLRGCGIAGPLFPMGAATVNYVAPDCLINWRAPTVEELSDLVQFCGGEVGATDSFQSALEQNGFRFPPGPARLWTSSYRTGESKVRVGSGSAGLRTISFTRMLAAFVEGEKRWDPTLDVNAMAMALLCRSLSPADGPYPAERDNYFYAARSL